MTVKIVHLNCGTMHAYGLPAADGTGGLLRRGLGVIHCLLVDTGSGLALVDTGWGWRDCTAPSTNVHQFMALTGCRSAPDETAVRQIEKLGYTPAEVGHIFLTHLHLDHAGGLPDFPHAAVHVLDVELDACLHPRTLMERWAYRPEHRAHGPRWQPHRLQGARWFGLDCTSPVQVGKATFVFVPLTGHTRGHCAVAVGTGAGWLLHCGDAYGYNRQADPVQPYRHPCGRPMEWLVTTGFRMPRRHWRRLRDLQRAHRDQIQLFCAHDAREFALCRARHEPAPGETRC